MMTAKRILETKGQHVWYIEPDASVFTAIERMAEHEIGALLVIDEKQMVGIISERDYARKVILRGRLSKETLVSEIMTQDVIWADLDCTIEECMALMTQMRIRHLPIVDEDLGQIEGIISMGDLVRNIIAEQQFVIEQLEQYITS